MGLDSYTKVTERVPRERGTEAELPWLQLLPPELGEGVVVLKNGAMLAGFEVDLVAYESVTDEELEGRSSALESVIRSLQEGCELQVEVMRDVVPVLRVPRCTSKNPVIREVETARCNFLRTTISTVIENTATLYLTWQPDRREPGRLSFVGNILWPAFLVRDFRAREHAILLKDFRGRIAALQSALKESGLAVRALSNQALIQKIRRACNPGSRTPISEVAPWEYVSDRVSYDDVVLGVNGLQFGGRFVAVMSHKTYPDVVFPYCLRPLARMPWPCRLVFGLDMTNQLRELEAQQKRFKWSYAWTNRASIDGHAAAPDKGAANKFAAHNVVIDQMMAANAKLLPVVMNIIVWANTEEELDERARSTASAWTQAMKGSDLLREGIASWEVFRSTLPGNLSASGRRRKYLSPKVADMMSGLFAGQASRGKCGRTTFWGREGELVPFSLFDSTDQDQLARNCLIFAQMGGGKSMLLANLILGELAQDPMVRIIDVGGSTALISELLGGVTQRFSLAEEHTDVVNPCDITALDDEAMAFLLSFLSVLLTKEKEQGLPMEVEGWLAELLKRVYVEKPEPGAVILSDIEAALRNHKDSIMQQFGARLAYVTHGPYGRILNRRSTKRLDDASIVYYDFQDAAADERLVRILMEAVTHDVLNMAHRVGPYRAKVLAMDEAWRITKSRSGGALIDMGARTSRKLKMSFLTVSQSLGDFNTPELRDSIVNNAELQFILKCPREDFRELARVFKLNEAELECIRSLRTVKGHFAESFCIRPKGRQVLRLRVPPEHYWIATTDPPDREAREKAFTKFGGDKWAAIRWLAKQYPQGMEAAGLASGTAGRDDEILREAA